MLVAYLQDTQLTVAAGEPGLPARVEKVAACEGLDGIVRDGVIVDATGFQNAVGEFWRDNALPVKDVKVVVRTRRITLQNVEAPVFRRDRDLDQYVEREVKVNARTADPCSAVLQKRVDKAAKKTQVLAEVAEKQLVERIVGTFAKMGVTVTAVASPHTTGIAVTRELARRYSGQTVLFLTADPDQSLATLFKNGDYEYSSEQHLFTDFGTPDFAAEMRRSVNNIEQFMLSERISERFDRICLYGMNAPATEAVRQTLGSYENAAPVDVIAQKDLVTGDAARGWIGEGGEATAVRRQQAASAIGGLVAAQDGAALVDAYRADSGTGMAASTKRGLLDALRIPAACLVVCLAAIIGLNVANAGLRGQISDLQAQASTPDAIKQLGTYLQAKADDDNAHALQDSADRLTGALQNYPVPGGNLESIIAGCTQNQVDCKATCYDEATGSYFILAQAGSERDLSAFIERLTAAGDSTGAFTVDNNGYKSVQVTSGSNGNGTPVLWVMNITLTLTAGEGR